MTGLYPVPVTIAEANDFVRSFHRHNRPVLSARFAIGASDGNAMVGVAIVGRPVARKLQDGVTAEVVRCCTLETAPKGAPSFLYAACWRAWPAMGGAKLITYTLQSEGGAFAGLTTSASLRLTTSTAQRNYGRLIGCIRRPSGSNYGRRRWAISRCFAQIATASRRGKTASADIACRRISEAYKQPRLFAEPRPQIKQESML